MEHRYALYLDEAELKAISRVYPGDDEHLLSAVMKAIRCLPWTPSPDQIDAYCSSIGWGKQPSTEEYATANLRRLKDLGWKLVKE